MKDRILLAHGSGGKLSQELVKHYLIDILGNPVLNILDDSAIVQMEGVLAFTTDSYVVQPIFFPGGDIGKIAVCGTVNDLSMCGAVPRYMSLALIIEEGLPLDDFKRIIQSIKLTADEAGVQIITGDTKVVDRDSTDKIFINTSGLGYVAPGIEISGHNAKPGDVVIISGTIGDHGIAVLSKREGIGFNTSLESDCAPLNKLVTDILDTSTAVNCFRDPTRGGLASTLNEIAEQSGVSVCIEEDKIPIREEVASACDMLGLDPLHIANEGKLVAIVDEKYADAILETMLKNKYGHRASIIGRVYGKNPGRVTMKTSLGTTRIVDILTGEPLPRIC